MTKFSKAIVTAAAGLALLTAAAGSALAHGTAEAGGATPHMQPAHMGQAHGGHAAAPNHGYGPHLGMKANMGLGMMMGSGTMGHGPMMGYGSTMDPGMMGHGMMGHGMMGHGMMGQGMMRMMQQMHREMMGHGMTGGGYGHGSADGKPAIQPDQDLSADDVRARIERSLKWHGNKRLKVGEVKELDDDTIVAEIVTLDDSLVDRLEVDRHSGSMHRTE
jgi:hypothetical protein